MTNITFQYPEAFWLFALLPLLLIFFLLYKVWHRRSAKKIGDPLLVKRLLQGYAPGRHVVKFLFLFLAFAIGVVTLANPRKEAEGEADVRKGIDMVMAVDISNSMLATDVAPNRLAAAKKLLSQIIKVRPNDRVALVIFAGNAYVQLPLTYDHSAAQLFLGNIHPGMVTAQGTDMGKALEQCREAFGETGGRYRTVLMLTDGETHDEQAVEAAKELANYGVQINTIGFGSPTGTTLMDPKTKTPKKDQSGNVVISRLNEEILQQLAATAKGKYIRYTDAFSVGKQVLSQLSTIKQTGLVDKSLLNFQTMYMWLAIPMLVLLTIELFFPDRKKRKA